MGVNDPDPSETPADRRSKRRDWPVRPFHRILKIENPNATPLPVPQDYPYSPLVFGAQKVKEQVEAKKRCA